MIPILSSLQNMLLSTSSFLSYPLHFNLIFPSIELACFTGFEVVFLLSWLIGCRYVLNVHFSYIMPQTLIVNYEVNSERSFK